MDISHILSTMSANKQLKIIYGTKFEVDTYIHWAEDSVILRYVL